MDSPPHRLRSSPHPARALRLCLSLLIGLAVGPVAVAEGPQPITPAERQAIQLLAMQCEHGFTPWQATLSRSSPIGSESERALEELEVRLGPNCTGSWELLTGDGKDTNQVLLAVEWNSGIDDLIVLDFRQESETGDLQLWNVRALADLTPAPESSAAYLVSPIADNSSDNSAATRAPLLLSAPPASALPASMLIILMIVCLLSLPLPAKNPAGKRRLAAAVTVLFLLPGCTGGPAEETTDTTAQGDPTAVIEDELGHLVELRRALVAPGSQGLLARLSQPLRDPDREHTRKIWFSQWLMTHSNGGAPLHEIEALLDGVDSPAAHLMRARSAMLAPQQSAVRDDALISYRQALSVMPWADGLRIEAAEVLSTLGFAERAEALLRAMARRGTRRADVYYALATGKLYDGDLESAEIHFLEAWELNPMSRQDVLESGALSHLLDPSRRVHPRLDFASVEEPEVFAGRAEGLTPLDLPGSAVAMASGAKLDIAWLDEQRRVRRSISIPLGATIASDSVERVAAGTWERTRTDSAMSRLNELARLARSPTALSRTRVREELTAVAERLGREYRWRELVELTNGIEDHVRWVDPEVARLRATALDQLGEKKRSTQLLAALVRDIVERDRYDPGTLFELSNILSTTYGRHETAIRLLEKANEQVRAPVADGRILQLKLEMKLEERFESYETQNFRILHPKGREEVVNKMGLVLEAEFDRLSQYIPVELERKIEVHVMGMNQFTDLYGGRVDIVGLYDGRIRVPLAEMWGFHPRLVSILTHELAHAMMAEYSDNQMPKWMHEGLAQLVEMVPQRVNPIEDYVRTARLLSFPMIEAVLRGFPNNALVAAAYDEAFWTLAYVEQRHGRRAIQQLLAAFKDGRSTDQALQQVLNMDSAEFDRALRDWWLGPAPELWLTSVHEYERQVQSGTGRKPGETDGINTRWQESMKR